MNYQFKTTNIKGKEYVEVNQRVIAFRQLSEYTGFSLETEILSLDSESCVIRAIVKNAQGNVVATGIAQEDKSSSRINQTSYVENCETSAVGRCLGFLGIGIQTSIATADEVDMAIKKQDAPQAITGTKKAKLTPTLVESMKDAVKAGKEQQVREALSRKYEATEQQLSDIFAK